MSHAAIAGASRQTFTVANKTYTLKPVVVGVYAEMEAYLLSLREDPLLLASRLAAQVPSSQHPAIWEAAFASATQCRLVTAQELSVFEKSVRGMAFRLYTCLKDNHPEINSVDAALQLLERAGEERVKEIGRKLELVSDEDALGN